MMKKVSIMAITAIIILFATQVASAKVDLSLDFGYTEISHNTKIITGAGEIPPEITPGNKKSDGFKVGLSLDYDFTRDFSLAGNFAASFFKDEAEFNKNIFSASLFAQYDVLKLFNNSLGFQAGVIDSFSSVENSKNYFFIALGAYADINPFLGLNLYLDAKFPIVTLFNEKPDDFRVFFYDVKAGLKYYITPNLFFGVEGAIGNSNYNGAKNETVKGTILNYEYKVVAYDYSIGAKLGFKF